MANEHLVILPAEWYLKVGCSCTYYAMFSTKYLETKKFEAPPHCPNTWKAEPQKEKCPFHFQKKLVARKSEKQGTFFFGVAERGEAVAGLSWSVRFSFKPPRTRSVRHHYLTLF